MFLLDFFKTGPDTPLLEDKDEIRRIYERKRRSVFFGLVFGYSFFYVCRLTISVVKKPMIDEGVLTPEELGTIGFAFFLAYAFGKLTNGFLADRSNIGRFMSTGLLVSAVILLILGFTKAFLVFAILWGVNGWFQAMGSAPSGASISQWFSNKERGTRYSIWSAAHPIGEGISLVFVAAVVSYLTWQWGFWVAGGVSVLVALCMYRLLADRPRTYGLPTVADYRNDHTVESVQDDNDVNRAQFEVVRNPYVWILGLSCTATYIARYGINSWGPMYLQEAKDYTLITAGLVLGWAKTFELAGAISSGIVSDRIFNARRNVVTLLYGLVMIAGLTTLYLGPSTHLASLDLSASQQFEDGSVSENLREMFAAQGLVLPDYASVQTVRRKTGSQKVIVQKVIRLKTAGKETAEPEATDWEAVEQDIFGGKTEKQEAVDREAVDQNRIDRSVWLVKNDRWYLFWTGYGVEETPERLKVTAKFHPAHLAGVALFGFGLGGLLVFVGGLIAIDICSKRAAGAAMGLVGMFSYLGAAVQDWISGKLIQAGAMTVDGQTVHDFTQAYLFWLGAAVVAVLLACTLWNVKAKD